MKYTGIVVSDIHVGAMSLNTIQYEFKKLLIDRIYSMKKLDFLIVCGDFFDHKFYLNDTESLVAYSMIKDLIEACRDKSAVIRFVYGTESHECNQYDVLSLLKIYDKIKVIKYAEAEELLPNLNVLYLPEEHLINKSEYYESLLYKNNNYDYIFGHGVIREVTTDIAVTIENRSGNKKRKEVPIFSSSELSSICNGQIYFGHYHLNKEYEDKVISVGSFSRWKFGEEERKGFYEINCDTDKSKYSYKYIENTLADSYSTINYSYSNFSDEQSINKMLSGIDNLIDRDLHNHVRFIFNVPTDVENPESTLNFIKEKYKFNDHIKTEIVHGYIELKKEQQKEQIHNENLKYDFIFNKELPISDKISRFIEIEYNKPIKTEDVHNYISLSLQDILTSENEIEH